MTDQRLPEYRVGLGFDFHAFGEGRNLVLGGVQIPHEQGLAGHSDADVLLHAVIDAMLGAAGLNDIGNLFPDSDARYKDISSLLLLEEVEGLVHEQGFRVSNVDVVVVAEEPRLNPFVETMKSNLCNRLKLKAAEVGIKATTMEGKGVVGRREGIAAQAVVLLRRVA